VTVLKCFLSRLARDRAGVTAVVIGLSMTALMGFAGLAVDVGLWYNDIRTAQGAVDSAAYSAAIDYAAGDNAAGITATVDAITAQYGLTNGAGGVTVTVNQPPLSGTHTATTGAVEVILQKTETRFFASLFMNSAAISARAVAAPGTTGGNYCIETLDTTPATTTASLVGGLTLDLSQCGIQVNAPGASALSLTQGAVLKANTVSIVGGDAVNQGAKITGTVTKSAPSQADPYSGVTMPTTSGTGTCLSSNYSSGGTKYQLSPGVYCGGLNIGNGASATLSPGVYIVQGGKFSLQGGTTVTGTGVTIVLTGSGNNYATVNIANNATLNLTAPTTGTTAGLAIFQDPNAPSTGNKTSNAFGGGTVNVTGALYFPHEAVAFNGAVAVNSSCTQLIAYDVSFSGNAKFGNSCAGTGVKGIGASPTKLVE
jgi:Flp pilus assembly protein TadG